MAAIDYALKRKCAELANSGVNYRDIYNTVFLPAHDGMGYETFRHKIKAWKHKKYTDDRTLETASLDWGFTPYAATVQVSGNGTVTQAWVKQAADSSKAYQELLEEIRKNTTPVYVPKEIENVGHMLELSLYDMHFGIADFDWYKQTLDDAVEVVNSRSWKKIIVTIGQDQFHNDDFRGRTSSGRPIEKVNMAKAWRDSKAFFYNIIRKSLRKAEEVELIYVPGNHSESMSWAFLQMLMEMFPEVDVDDSFSVRKVRTFGDCFVGMTHGCAKKSTPRDLRGQFTIEFPIEFANAKVREIHVGHLHTEQEADEYGVMCRRLCTGNKEDEWSDTEGFVGSHKRFMLFDWSEDKLAAIHYV